MVGWDKLKDCLPAGAVNYVLSLAGNDGCDLRRIVELADTNASNHNGAEKRKPVNSAYVVNTGSMSPKVNTKSGERVGHASQTATGRQLSKEIVCYNCQSNGHVAKFCPRSSGALKVARRLVCRLVRLDVVIAVNRLSIYFASVRRPM